MKTELIPIVFSFNDKFTIPAGVCITSLLDNAKKTTTYDIYILHSSERLSVENKNKIGALKASYPNCNITFIDVKNSFRDGYEIRDISIDAYYRLKIPQVIKQYDKIIYADVDIVFTGDLSNLYLQDISKYSIAAVKVPEAYIAPHIKHLKEYGVKASEYFNSGFFMMNTKALNQNDLFEKWVSELIMKNFTYQDQDMLNIIFRGKTFFLNNTYNYTINWLKYDKSYVMPIVVHYTGEKPWSTVRSFGELWWEYYRKSPFFNNEQYIKFQQSKYIDLYNNNKIIAILKKIGVVRFLESFMKNK